MDSRLAASIYRALIQQVSHRAIPISFVFLICRDVIKTLASGPDVYDSGPHRCLSHHGRLPRNYVFDAHHHGMGAKMHGLALGAPVRLGGNPTPDMRELSGLSPRLMRSDQLKWSRLLSNGAERLSNGAGFAD